MPDREPQSISRRYPPPARPSRSFRMPRAVGALVLREMATTYGRSPGGYLWAIAEPVGAIAILTLIFSVMLRAPALGTSFPLFYATGFLPFAMFTLQSARIGSALSYSKALLAYPAVTFVDALLARFLLALVTNLLVTALVLSGVIVLFDLHVLVDFPTVIEAMAMAALLGAGVGALNSYLSLAFPVWDRAWGILTRPLLLLSGILWVFEDLPRFARDILWWNPLVHVIGLMRRGIYSTYDAAYVSAAYVIGFALVCMLAGLALLVRFHRDLLQN